MFHLPSSVGAPVGKVKQAVNERRILHILCEDGRVSRISSFTCQLTSTEKNAILHAIKAKDIAKV